MIRLFDFWVLFKFFILIFLSSQSLNAITLSEGLDFETDWVLYDGSSWFGQNVDYSYDGDAISSHEVNYGTTSIGMLVTDNAILNFQYKISTNLADPSLDIIRNNSIIQNVNILNSWTNYSIMVSPGDNIRWRFKDYDVSGNSIFSLDNVQLSTDFGELDQPEIVYIYSGSTSNAFFTWDEVNGAIDYEIYRNTLNDLASSEKISTVRHLKRFDDAEATPGIVYYYWVRATNPIFQSEFSEVIEAYRRSDPPENVFATDGTFQDNITVSWDHFDHANYYDVYRNIKNSSSGREKLVTVYNNTFVDYNVASEKKYYYWVVTGNTTTGFSLFSDSDNGFSNAEHIALDEALDTTDLNWTTNSNMELAWFGQTNVSDDGVDAAQSPLFTTNGESFVSTTAPFDGTLIFDWKLLSESRYSSYDFLINNVIKRNYPDNLKEWKKEHIRLSHGDNLKWITENINSVALLDNIQLLDYYVRPLPPEIISIKTTPSFEGLELKWVSVDYADHYSIFRGSSSNLLEATKIAEENDIRFYDYGIPEKGKLYFYWIQASNVYGGSEFSEVQSGGLPLPKTAHISADVDQKQGNLTLNWLEVEGADYYNVHIATRPNDYGPSIATTTDTNFSGNFFSEDFIHYFYVRGENDEVSGLSSERVQVFLRSDDVSLGEALDTPHLVWKTNPEDAWYGHQAESFDGVDSARINYFGELVDQELSTTSSANGVLSFYWKLEPNKSGHFNFYINEVEKEYSGQTNGWERESYYVHSGDNLKWVFGKRTQDEYEIAGIDQISFSDNIPIPQRTVSIVKNTIDGKVKFDWTDMQNVYEYFIYRSESEDSSDAIFIGRSRDDSYIDDSSNGDTLYYYWIVSSNPSGNSNFSNPIASNRSFGVPFSLNASRGDYSNKIHLSWDSHYPNSKFAVSRSESIHGNKVELAEVQGSNFVDLTVDRGAIYYYWVQEAGESSRGNYSSPINGFATQHPDFPTNFIASDNLELPTIQLSWDSAYDASSYNIYRKYRENEFQFITNTTSLNYVDSNVEANTLYDYYVKALNQHGESFASNIDTGFYLNNNLTIEEAIDSNGVTWETGGDFIWFGQTSKSLDGVDAVMSGNMGAGKESYLQTYANITGVVEFDYKTSIASLDKLKFFINEKEIDLEKNNGTVESNWIKRQFLINDGDLLGWKLIRGQIENAQEQQMINAIWLDNFKLDLTHSEPSSPQNLVAYSLPTKVVLGWDLSDLVTVYKIYKRNISDGGQWELISTQVPDSLNSYEDLFVSQGKRYEYYITAMNNYGESPRSNYVVSYRKFEQPTRVEATRAIYSDHVLISWRPVTGASNYQIYKSHRSHLYPLDSPIASTSNIMFKDDGDFIANRQYNYWVTASNDYEAIESGPNSDSTVGYPRINSSNYLDVNDSLDLNIFSWTKTGLGHFFGQDYHSYDGVDAVQINYVPEGSFLLVTTTSQYSGNLSFQMKLAEDIRAFSQKFTFFVNDLKIKELNMMSDWVPVHAQISEGDVLKFRFDNPSSRVSSVSGYGLIDEMNFTPDFPAPEAPSNLLIHIISDGRLNLRWDPVDYAEFYDVYKSSDNLFSHALLVSENIERESYYDSDVIRGEVYYYWVKAKNIAGDSLISSSARGVSPLLASTKIWATQGGFTDNILVRWNAVEYATEYEVVKRTLDGNGNPAESIFNISGNTYMDDAITNNLKYYYQVIPHNENIDGDISDITLGYAHDPSISISEAVDNNLLTWENSVNYPWSGQTYDSYSDGDALVSGLIAPVQTSILKASSNVSGNLSFYWNKNSKLADDFDFFINDTLVTSVSGTKQWKQVNVLVSKGDNLKWVFTKNEKDLFFQALRGVAFLDDFKFSPYVPSGLTATQDGLQSIIISWDEVEDSIGYKLYRSHDPAFSDSNLIASLGRYSYEDKSIEIGREYYYRVVSFFNQDEESDLSSIVKGKTLLEPPSLLDATDDYFEKVELTWSHQLNADQYRIYRGLTESDPNLIAEVSGNNYVDQGLDHGINYIYWVTSKNDYAESEFSNLRYGSLSKVPNNIEELEASYGTYPGNVKLSWNESSGAQEYIIYRSTSNVFIEAKQLILLSGNNFIDENLLYDQPYYYWVQPKNPDGLASRSESALGLASGLTVSYDEMLGGRNFSWSSTGNAVWVSQDYFFTDGLGGVQSGKISDNEKTTLQMFAPNNGKVCFYWKVSSEKDKDNLKFYINEKVEFQISGNVEWQKICANVIKGDLLQWVFEKDERNSFGDDFAWIDDVKFFADTPELKITLESPTKLLIPSDSDHEFVVNLDSMNREISSFSLTLGFDEDKLSIDISDPEKFSSENRFGTPQIYQSMSNMITFSKAIDNVLSGNQLMLFKLPVEVTASPGETIEFNVSTSYIESKNTDGIIEFLLANYQIQPFNTIDWIKGDVNGDEKLSILDALLISMYLEGLKEKSDLIGLDFADMDNNFIIDEKDVIYISEILSGKRN